MRLRCDWRKVGWSYLETRASPVSHRAIRRRRRRTCIRCPFVLSIVVFYGAIKQLTSNRLRTSSGNRADCRMEAKEAEESEETEEAKRNVIIREDSSLGFSAPVAPLHNLAALAFYMKWMCNGGGWCRVAGLLLEL